MTKNQTILNYKGPIEFKTTEILLQKVKNDLEGHNIKKVLKKRVYNIMVECIENILRHNAPDPDTKIHPYIVLEKGAGEFLITAGNLITNDDVGLLKEKLNIVSNLNKEDLLKMYDNQINKEDVIIEDGAGLGIITIALKSNSKINYSFTAVNEQLSVFELQITVPFDPFL
ncbi:MAG: SiaB family protein kinase [Bacteroidales bacterium]|nr:SiaB family protein kinase [Bacteroidales bacterium]